ncbi:MAG: hypothetical protein PHV43_00425 [Candidatus Colwellbacteria bacterium]|nr:hypothetical protein [Candidatus Colwellbacteria bacterium]
MKFFKEWPISIVACLQAAALFAYVGLVGWLVSRAENWLPETPIFLNIAFFLGVFTTSALVSATLTLIYPAYVFWKERNISKSIKLILATIAWLFIFLMAFAVLVSL